MPNPVDEFLTARDELEGQEKDAGFWKSMTGEFARGGGLGGTVGRYLPAAAVSLGVASAVGGLGKAFNAIRNRMTKQRDYKNMLAANPHLRKEDASKVQMLYNSLRSMSPSMSKDPLIAGSFVRSSLDLSPESGPAVPPATAQMLAKTQESLSKAKSKGPTQHLPGMPPISLAPPERPESPRLVGEVSERMPVGDQGGFRTQTRKLYK